jgi:sulfatase modifying factor 1
LEKIISFLEGRKMKKLFVLSIIVLVCISSFAYADIFGTGANQFDIEFATIANAGNAADSTGYGAVDHDYRIGSYEVTAGQYSQFLNTAAQNDTFALYNSDMWSSSQGCKITRSGSSGSYSYSVSADRENRPVNYLSWYDAARFCNYLTTGNTEEGVYNTTTWSINRSQAQAAFGTIYFIPSEDEWYKAAYHKNDGVTGNYWLYPTQSNEEPSNDILNPDGGNNANFYQDGFAIGEPYWMTEVGEFENSDSSYGTFDQGGNVWEFNETMFGSNRGGTAGGYGYYLASTGRYDYHGPDDEGSSVAFRVASVPEPATLLLFALGTLALRKRRK